MLVALAAVFGLLIGSFLNVVVWRLPRGESLASPPSRCPRCETPIKPYDNIPVVSWLVLRGKCRRCGERISARYPLVELATGVLFAGLAARIGYDWALPAFLYLGAICVALALIDLDTKRLPNAIVLPSYGVGAVLLGGAALLNDDLDALIRAAIGMAALYGVYLLLLVAYPAGMGFGDVKLAGVLGMYLGYLGWPEWFTGWLLGFFLGGIFGVVAMAAGKAGRKTMVPYGPFMILGALLAVFWGGRIADAYLGLSGV
ncbi:MAG TPA: prepilin peptidase [Frankiaceae bacterium]|nr:prepilin peptidase [Frankiaceae bacterium]